MAPNLPEVGYIVLEGVFTRELCASWADRLNQVATRRAGSSADIDIAGHRHARINTDPANTSRIHKIQSVALAEPDVLDFFRNDKIVTAARRALVDGKAEIEALDVFGTKFFPMQPGGTSVSWHQDSYYFGSGGFEARCLSCAIYLEDTTRTNGCLRVVPGSHLPTWDSGAIERTKDGLLPHKAGEGRWAHGDWIQNIPEDVAMDLKVPAGAVVLFDPRLVHAAHANESDTSRTSLFGHLILRSETFVYKKHSIDFTFGEYADRHEIAGALA